MAIDYKNAPENFIKELLENNLKVVTNIKFPNTLSNGYLSTTVYYDNDIISEYTQEIKSGSTLFSF